MIRWILALVLVSSLAQAKIEYYDEVEKFVANWFVKLDTFAPVDQLEQDLAEGVRFHLETERFDGKEGFRKWYKAAKSNYKSVNHNIRKVEIRALSDTKCEVTIVALWTAQPHSGDSMDSLVEQKWRLIEVDDKLKFQKYVVKEYVPEKRESRSQY